MTLLTIFMNARRFTGAWLHSGQVRVRTGIPAVIGEKSGSWSNTCARISLDSHCDSKMVSRFGWVQPNPTLRERTGNYPCPNTGLSFADSGSDGNVTESLFAADAQSPFARFNARSALFATHAEVADKPL